MAKLKKTKQLTTRNHHTRRTTKHSKSRSMGFGFPSFSIAPLATLGPLGYFPKGSGTIGALVSLPFIYFLNRYNIFLFWGVTFVLAGLGIFATKQFTQNLKEKDPSCVIIDEFVGQMIPFLVVIPTFMHWPMLLMGFILFRFFDIFKFGTVAFWDNRKDPVGVMMDDVTAGIFSGFIIAMLQLFNLEFFTNIM